MCVCALVSVYTMCMQVPTKQEEDYGCWESKSLQEQQVCLSDEPSLQPSVKFSNSKDRE